jgi:hypothetical protein
MSSTPPRVFVEIVSFFRRFQIASILSRQVDLSPKDIQLVSEHDDLEILGGLALAIPTSSLSSIRTTRYTSDRSIGSSFDR